MQAFTTVVLPFFAFVICGYVGTRIKWLPKGIVTAVNTFVVYLALPVMIVRALATQELHQIINYGFIGAYLTAWLVVFITTAWLCHRLFNAKFGEAVIQGYGGSYSNTGYIGLPVLAVVLGDWAIGPVASIVAVDIAITIPVVLFLLEAGNSRATNWASWTGNVLLRTISQPLLIAVIIGLVLTISNIQLPLPVDDAMRYLGAAAAPCALFALGATLARQPLPERMTEVISLSLIKLIIHPIIALLLMSLVFTLDPEWIKLGVLATALPTAATVFVLAEHYKTRVISASNAVLVSTTASLVTVPALAYFMFG